MIHRVPSGDGSFETYISLRWAILAVVLLLVAALFALALVKSQDCRDARNAAAELTTELMEARREIEVLEPWAIEGIGLRAAEARNVADSLAAHLAEGRGRGRSPFYLTHSTGAIQ